MVRKAERFILHILLDFGVASHQATVYGGDGCLSE